ncbi:hypothetical protein GYMLUDRAFT_255891 [Collybiopsis luxurians FD-317 M1]|nr:hypothetical protein GYMLUDRAFT_255891 [Collybiopsis luxurians FD-317 M1]
MSPPTPTNVILFGSTGCGKSSIINMLLDNQSNPAPTSNGTMGCTAEPNSYTTTIEGHNYQLYDTNGLDQGSMGTVSSKDALINLYHLLRDLQGGITLLVYCIRGPTFISGFKQNYDILFNGFCHKSIPIVLVVTGLEDEEPDMESWWKTNGENFTVNGMHFNGHACVAATPGKRMRNGRNSKQAEYDESRVVLRNLIIEQCRNATPCKLVRNPTPGLRSP